ncbi:MAG: phosphoribosyl-AMP cyclohydrolase [Candidatus Hadarchaeia archaeon]
MKLSDEEAEVVLEEANFKDGLITCVVRDFRDGEILMVAFMNERALRETLTSGYMTYWSRSRKEIWRKGEESGNKQKLRKVRIDCDADAFLFNVEPEGPACHKGYRSCFFREVEDGNIRRIMEQEFNPDNVYG